MSAAVLDVACGSRMFYFDREDERVLFMDNRAEEHHLTDASSVGDRLTGVAVSCNGNETHFFEMKRLEDFAQFFRPVDVDGLAKGQK